MGAGIIEARLAGTPDSAYAAQWLVQRSLALFGILLCAHALVLLYASPDAESSLIASNRLFQVMSGATYGAAGLWLLPRLRVIRRIARANAWLFALISLALISALWSQLPEVSARRAAALSLSFIFTLFLVLRFPPEKLLRLVFIALTASAVASLVAVAVAPDIGIHQGDSHVGAWRGVFGHKNSAGRMMSLAVVIGLLLVGHTKRRRMLHFAGLIPTLFLLAMSGSATGWVATVAALISVPPLLAARGMPITPTVRFAVALCIFGLVGCLFLLLFEPTLALVGRDPTLSGRTRLWELAFAHGLDNPILGIGYRAFWVDIGPAAQVMAAVSWGNENIGNGHNAYLDLWLELGTAGAWIFTILLLSAARRVIAGFSAKSDPTPLWFGVLAVHSCLYAVTEVVILGHSDLGWMLFVAFYLYMTPALTWARYPCLPRSSAARSPHAGGRRDSRSTSRRKPASTVA